MRGVARSRDRGQARILINGELRWRGVPVWRAQQMFLGRVLFVDSGQILANDELPASGNWRADRGAGLRFHWYSTIVRADYGVAQNRTAICITFSQMF